MSQSKLGLDREEVVRSQLVYRRRFVFLMECVLVMCGRYGASSYGLAMSVEVLLMGPTVHALHGRSLALVQ